MPGNDFQYKKSLNFGFIYLIVWYIFQKNSSFLVSVQPLRHEGAKKEYDV